MNSDKFDRIVLDLLYGELDELTTAAAKRHMDQSARAREIFAHFKATRQLSVLPIHMPPVDFEASLMERQGRALAELPLYHRIGRVVSMLAGYAMRPQLIMGALLLLMIGSSLMFLRARPGQHSAVQVTERGAPEADVDLILPVATSAPEAPAPLTSGVFRALPAAEAAPAAPSTAPAAPASNASGAAAAHPSAVPSVEGLDPFDQALELYQDGKYVEAQRRFERLSRAGGRRAAEAALYAAQSVRSSAGCAPAVRHFERVRLDFPGSPSAYEATWRAAKCLQQTGDLAGARHNYEALLQVSSHAERARVALTALGGPAPKTAAATLGSPPAKPASVTPGAAKTPPRGARPSSTGAR